MTQLELVNNVLRRLREDEVTSIADNAYSQLLAMWLNDGITEVTNSYDFTALRHDITVAIAIGQSDYDLANTIAMSGDVPNAERVTTLESLLMWIDTRPQAYLYADGSATDVDQFLRYITPDEMKRKQQLDVDPNTYPSFFTLETDTAGKGLALTVWPEPATVRELRMTFWTPQAELAIDGTDDATSIIVPNKPVEAYVHLTAANERGEEIGEPGNMLERVYLARLAEIIEAAMSSDVRANRYESRRD